MLLTPMAASGTSSSRSRQKIPQVRGTDRPLRDAGVDEDAAPVINAQSRRPSTRNARAKRRRAKFVLWSVKNRWRRGRQPPGERSGQVIPHVHERQVRMEAERQDKRPRRRKKSGQTRSRADGRHGNAGRERADGITRTKNAAVKAVIVMEENADESAGDDRCR